MRIYKLTNNIFIREFLLPSKPFNKGQHPASMIQNVVLYNSCRQTAIACPTQINISSKLQRSLQDKLCTTHMTPGPPLHFVQVHIYYPRHMKINIDSLSCGSGNMIRRFTWFGPPERNTLRPRENGVILLKPALPEPAFLSASLDRLIFFDPMKRCLPGPFIAQGRVVTMRPGARQVAPRWLKPYTTSRALMARSS
jgi:hypothetical protein